MRPSGFDDHPRHHGVWWHGLGSPVGHIDVEGARKQIGLARDAGVNLFDTADVYSSGLSEEILGQALGSDRDEVLIATKVRMSMGDGPNDMASPGITSSEVPRTVFDGWEPITSTSTRYTNGTATPRSRKRSMLSTTLSQWQGALCRLLQLRRMATYEGTLGC